MPKIIKTEIFVSKLETFSVIVLLIFINIGSRLELYKSSLASNKFPELIRVYKTHSYNISLSSRFQVIPQLVCSMFAWACGALCV